MPAAMLSDVLYQGGGLLSTFSATRVWITSKGLLQTGITVPDGTFGISLVTSGEVITGGNTIGANEVLEDGILNIEDIRTGI